MTGRSFNARSPVLVWLLPLVLIGCGSSDRAPTPEAPLPTPTPDPPAVTTPFDVLVLTRTQGFRHGAAITAGVSAMNALGSANDFTVTVTEDPTLFTATGLARFEVVMFLNTTGDVLNNAQQEAMEEFIRAGGGFVGVHSATDTEYEWPWYGRLVGAYFVDHPDNPNVRPGTLNVVNRDHPATRDLPNPWRLNEEWYSFRDVSPDIRPLLKLDPNSYDPGDAPRMNDHPIAWTQEYDGGRSFYTALGHEASMFADPTFRRHLLGGVLWAAGREGT